MKTRHGFVANSSTSSFLLYGSYVDSQALLDAFNSRCGTEVDYANEYYLRKIDSSVPVWLAIHDMYSEIVVGRSYMTLGDDETGAQFKQATEQELARLFPGIEFRFGVQEGEYAS